MHCLCPCRENLGVEIITAETHPIAKFRHGLAPYQFLFDKV